MTLNRMRTREVYDTWMAAEPTRATEGTDEYHVRYPPTTMLTGRAFRENGRAASGRRNVF